MRFRVGVIGKLFGVIPVCWTLLAVNVDGAGKVAAHWFCDTFNGEAIPKNKYLSGSIFATLTPKEVDYHA